MSVVHEHDLIDTQCHTQRLLVIRHILSTMFITAL